ncbi:25379_t:CDS:2 [Gigaspora margarita]|uniref:25379_t:CDS:1 n=1 Tax=Gigaspora margarita TaxID=4874 RepID=A0ABN7UXD3_GIGMA|nr:25379_t:CDS:2 [Gigaspora margarita]
MVLANFLKEVDEFPITVEKKTITLCIIVFKAGNYAVIIKNDWLKKAKTRCKMNNDKEELDKESESKEKMESENEEKKKEYKDENLINETYFY